MYLNFSVAKFHESNKNKKQQKQTFNFSFLCFFFLEHIKASLERHVVIVASANNAQQPH